MLIDLASGSRQRALHKNHSNWLRNSQRTGITGNAIHNSHQMLGLMALKDDDLDSAVSHLLQAGNSPGSPQLKSFGPRMLLAAELVRRGQVEPVLQYLDRISRFFTADQPLPAPDLLADRKKLAPWWLRWTFVPSFTQHQHAEYVRDKRATMRCTWKKKEVKAGRVPDDKRWVTEL